MRIFLFLAIACAALGAGLNNVSAKSFNGEVLIAPPPANWTGGSPEKTKNDIRRIWRRSVPDDRKVTEQIVINRIIRNTASGANVPTDVVDVARRAAAIITGRCKEQSVSNPVRHKATIGSIASVTVKCKSLTIGEPGATLFAVIRSLGGEFDTFTVERTWTGNINDPDSPANSPRTALAWTTYFNRVSVCNTLIDACDLAQAEIIHAHPRFKEMRALPVTAKPTMTRDEVLAGATGLGELTGRAEACGEDIEPLVGKIVRMFDYIARNDKDSVDAQNRFKTASDEGHSIQSKQPKECCGPILREYRQHPTRVSVFHRYLKKFI